MPSYFKISCRRADPEDRDSRNEIVISSNEIGQEVADLVRRWYEHDKVRSALSDTVQTMLNAPQGVDFNDRKLLTAMREEWSWQSTLTMQLVNEIRERVMHALGLTVLAIGESRLSVDAVGPGDGVGPPFGDLIFQWPDGSPNLETLRAGDIPDLAPSQSPDKAGEAVAADPAVAPGPDDAPAPGVVEESDEPA